MIDFHTYSKIQDFYHRKHLSYNKISKILSLDQRTVSVWVKKSRYEQRKKEIKLVF
jgi:DNA-binding transcriptional regulator LsrR (DeoR family)